MKNRDSTIVSFADTGTSILAGVTIFSILGNLAYEKGQLDDIGSVVASGPGLAFVSYPEAISKFDAVPQVINIFKNHFLDILLKCLFSISYLLCCSSWCWSHWPSAALQDWLVASLQSFVMIFLKRNVGSSLLSSV